MKKYKLIKKYPSLPNDWEVGMIVGTGDRNGYTASYSPCSVKYTDKHINYNEVVNNPEFWQEVIEYPVGTKVKDTIGGFIYTKTDKSWESISIQRLDESEIGEGKRFQIIEEPKKDYEILSLLDSCNKIITKEEIWFNGLLYQFNIGNKYVKIHSVKRLSDSEIFTVGDEIFDNHSKQIITDLIIQENKIRVNYKSPINAQKYWNYLTNIQKAKPVLFTTEDGVDIREGDKFYAVQNNTFDLLNCVYKLDNPLNWKTFSTKEAAEEYILMNRPCLSINEFEQTVTRGVLAYRELLKQLVKSKL